MPEAAAQRRLRNVAERQRLHDWERAAAHHAVRQQRIGGAELAAPVEKAVAGLARAVAAPVEEADELEKDTAGRRCGGEGGRWAGGREARWIGRKASARARAWWRCWLSGPRPPWRMLRRRSGARSQRSASARAKVIFSREWRQHDAVRGEWTRGYDY